MNHPAGRIGKRLILKVHDLMLRGAALPRLVAAQRLDEFANRCLPELCYPHRVPPLMKVVDCLVEMSIKGCGCVLVVDSEDRLMGTFTDGDMRRALQRWGPSMVEKEVETFMFKKPAVVASSLKAIDALQVSYVSGKPSAEYHDNSFPCLRVMSLTGVCRCANADNSVFIHQTAGHGIPAKADVSSCRGRHQIGGTCDTARVGYSRFMKLESISCVSGSHLEFSMLL